MYHCTLQSPNPIYNELSTKASREDTRAKKHASRESVDNENSSLRMWADVRSNREVVRKYHIQPHV